MIDDPSNQPSKFITKYWVELNCESRGTYKNISQFKFKSTMLKSSLRDNSDACILVKGRITITGAGADEAIIQADKKIRV